MHIKLIIAPILRTTNALGMEYKLLAKDCTLMRRASSSAEHQNNGIDVQHPSEKMPILPTKARSKGEPLDFIDYKRVVCTAGHGGHGLISFLREKNIEFGGADGGNGGNGGHVIFKADAKTTDLSHLKFSLRAQSGIKGQGKCCHGRSGEHLYVPVPLNTLIKRPSSDELRPSKDIIWELTRDGEMFIAARGGAGGHGNAFYLSNMVRKPLKAEEGGSGEKISYDIEMRVMATAGLVGFANVGKSTLLRAISRAKPKVAAYPFTTMKPSVGMVQYMDCFQLAVADIPGLVEGASRNEGLGFSFLRHIVRCECILYVLDPTLGALGTQLEALKRELELYDPELMAKESAIIVNKVDTPNLQAELERTTTEAFPRQQTFLISGKYRLNLESMLMFLRQKHERFLLERQAKAEEETQQMMI